MKNFGLLIMTIGLSMTSCNNANQTSKLTETSVDNLTTDFKNNDTTEIERLIRNVFIWSDTSTIGLVPLIGDSSNRPIGFDFNEVNIIKDAFKRSSLFSKGFTNNYERIITTLDKKIRNKEYGDIEWYVNELPIFGFANGWNPWCCCQCICSEDDYTIEIIKINKDFCELKIKRGQGSSWIYFKAETKKENDIWRISYLEGFDYEAGIK